MIEKKFDKYGAIINFEHPTSKKHKRMSMMNRAAQFAPFAALTGYDEAIRETGRYTSEKVELDENQKDILDEKLFLIMGKSEKPVVQITYFVPDEKKTGGEYVTIEGKIKKTDNFEHTIVMQDNTIIKIEMITDIN